MQAQIKENIKGPCHWSLCGEFPAQMASKAENVSIWWRHHAGISRGSTLSLFLFCICKIVAWLHCWQTAVTAVTALSHRYDALFDFILFY